MVDRQFGSIYCDWQRALEPRDGEASNPSVAIHRRKDTTVPVAILQLGKTTIVSQSCATDQGDLTCREAENENLIYYRVDTEAVLVERGAGVNYAETDGPPYLPVDEIRQEFGLRTWKEIKAKHEARSEELTRWINRNKTAW